jgi:hypothetical protein
MKLSKDQIAVIITSFSEMKIYYEDIRNELIDHAASKIEQLMESGATFEEAFHSARKDVNPFNFQKRVLISTHLGFFKTIFSNIFRGTIILKTIPVFGFHLFFIYHLYNLSPEEAEAYIKTISISTILGLAIIALWGGLLKNSLIVSAGNSLWLTICLAQFTLDLDLLIFMGFSPNSAIYFITYSLSLLFTSGLSQVAIQIKKMEIA